MITYVRVKDHADLVKSTMFRIFMDGELVANILIANEDADRFEHLSKGEVKECNCQCESIFRLKFKGREISWCVDCGKKA